MIKDCNGLQQERLGLVQCCTYKMGFMPIFLLRDLENLKDRLRELIEPVVEGLGCDLWGIEHLPQGKYSILRIYIESSEGVDIKDCERISRQVSSLFDVEEPLRGQYTLEVSSPGMDRRLFTIEQFAAYAGANVKLNLRTAFEGRRKFSGRLCGVEDGDVVIRIDQEEYLLPFDTIDKASIVPDFE